MNVVNMWPASSSITSSSGGPSARPTALAQTAATVLDGLLLVERFSREAEIAGRLFEAGEDSESRAFRDFRNTYRGLLAECASGLLTREELHALAQILAGLRAHLLDQIESLSAWQAAAAAVDPTRTLYTPPRRLLSARGLSDRPTEDYGDPILIGQLKGFVGE